MTEREISDEDCEHVVFVWKIITMKNMKDYHNLYLKVDAVLLADVFENIRNESTNSFKLDLA